MKLIGVQYLRAVAALMVVVFHVRPRIEAMGYAGGWPEWMQAGVDVFFVISGFIMWVTTERGISPQRFIRNRIVRIVPLYWTVTTVAVLLTGSVTWHTAASYLFLPAVHPSGKYWPVVIPGWTLNYEMFFYALFALTLNLPQRARLPVMAAALSGLAALDLPGPAGFYTESIVLEFLFGMALGAYRDKLPRLGWLGILLGFAMFPLLESLPRFIGYGLPALVIVASVVSMEPVRAYRLPALLGDASYSLYLVHGYTLVVLAKLWPFGWPLFIPAALVATSLAGIAVYWLVERPSIAMLKRSRNNPLDAPAEQRPDGSRGKVHVDGELG